MTIVLIHGLWITAASWDGWAERYRAAGHDVLTPPWPELDRPVADINRDPGRLAELTTPKVLDHLAAVVESCDEPPILIGHSFGGLLVQLLLDRGLGAAGVALHSGGPRGVRTVSLSTLRALLPILRNPANRRRVAPVTAEGFHASAANALSGEAAHAAWERDIVPAPGRLVFDLALSNANPRTPLRVDLKRLDRAPLLFIAGGEDRMATPRYVQENARRQSAAYEEFPGRSHYVNQAGWEAVADRALAWATSAA